MAKTRAPTPVKKWTATRDCTTVERTLASPTSSPSPSAVNNVPVLQIASVRKIRVMNTNADFKCETGILGESAASVHYPSGSTSVFRQWFCSVDFSPHEELLTT